MSWLPGEMNHLGYRNRPRRKSFSLKRIAEYWGVRDIRPFCFRCDRTFINAAKWEQANGYLERAHIIDRVFDGLDSPSNIVPLCGSCHGGQPVFKAGDEWLALIWTGANLLDPARDLIRCFASTLEDFQAAGRSTPYALWMERSYEEVTGT